MVVALVFTALIATCAASQPIQFGRSGTCVLSDGRQGRCMHAYACAEVSGPVLPDCVKPCGLAHGELLLCCSLDTTPPATQCGLSGAAGNLRRNIAFGRPSLQGRWPWMALFGWTDSSGRHSWQCGGALISARHVLTAAHCVENRGALGMVRLGEHDLSDTADGEHQDVRVLRAAVPPSRRGDHDDIAVLTLAEPVRLSERVRPVCLPSAARGQPPVGQDVTVAGWGRLEFGGSTSDVLQEAIQQVLPTDKCEENFSRLPFFSDKYPGGFGSSKICARDTTGGSGDSCRGDSGGPLVARNADGMSYSVLGVVSSGIGCGSPDFPSIYTRVSSYLEWIEEQMAWRPSDADSTVSFEG